MAHRRVARSIAMHQSSTLATCRLVMRSLSLSLSLLSLVAAPLLFPPTLSYDTSYLCGVVVVVAVSVCAWVCLFVCDVGREKRGYARWFCVHRSLQPLLSRMLLCFWDRLVLYVSCGCVEGREREAPKCAGAKHESLLFTCRLCPHVMRL